MVPPMRSPFARLSRLAPLWLLASAALACGARPPAPVAAPPPRSAAKPAAAPVEDANLLPATVLMRIEDEKSSPIFARRGDESLLIYSAGGRWLSRALGADGKPKAQTPVDIGPSPGAALTALKAAGDGYLVAWGEAVSTNRALKVFPLDRDGKPRGEPMLIAQIAEEIAWIDVLPNAQGALVLWDVPREDRADLFVAPLVGGKLEASSLVASGVIGWEATSTERGAALAIIVTPTPTTPAAPPAKGKKGASTAPPGEVRATMLGAVSLVDVDVHGKPAPAVLVSPEPTAQVDVQIAEVAGKYVIAWTDERAIDACVYTASVEPGGKVATPPRRATAPFGEQALVSLVAEPYAPGGAKSKRAILAWEDLLKAPRDGRSIHLATLGPDGVLGKDRATLVLAANGPPDIEPDGDGFAALTLSPVTDVEGAGAAPPSPAAPRAGSPSAAASATPSRSPGADAASPAPGSPAASAAPPSSASSAKREVWPSFVRFAPDLSVIASEPIRAAALGGDGLPELTWALGCVGGDCSALASGSGLNAPLAVISLLARKSAWKPPAWRESEDALPRAASVSALYDGDHLAEVAAAELPGGAALAAWVTYFIDEGAGGKRVGKPEKAPAGTAATLSVRPIGEDGAPFKPVILAQNALSVGGVAIASPRAEAPAGENGKKPAPAGKGAEAVVAWVARERGEGQVTVTRVGANGDKLAQKAVTNVSRAPRKGAPPSEASDVAIADTGDGYVVAWVDTRDGNAEIYAAKLDRALNKIVPDRRITEAPGDSAEVQIAIRDKEVVLVWSDARKNADEGSGDIYLARLEASTLKKVAVEARLFASPLHSRTPQIALSGSGFMVSWIEDAFGAGKGDAAASSERGLRLLLVDGQGAPVGAPQLLRGEQQAPVTSAALACSPEKGGGCRGVLTSAVGEALVLGAFSVNPGSPPGRLQTLATLTGANTEDVSPAFVGRRGTSLFFADDAVGGAGRARWMQIIWP
jgi:hypothetical protein